MAVWYFTIVEYDWWDSTGIGILWSGVLHCILWLDSFLQGSETDHRSAHTDFISWWHSNFFGLVVSKTKELTIDFRGNKDAAKDYIIHNETVEMVTLYKYLVTVFDCLKFDVNRGQQRIHLLCKLNTFSVSSVILCPFSPNLLWIVFWAFLFASFIASQ